MPLAGLATRLDRGDSLAQAPDQGYKFANIKISHTRGGRMSQADVRDDPRTHPRKQIHRRRRLSDDILIAFHLACDQGDLEVAALLVNVLEKLALRETSRPNDARRSNLEILVAALSRLWELRNDDDGVHIW